MNTFTKSLLILLNVLHIYSILLSKHIYLFTFRCSKITQSMHLVVRTLFKACWVFNDRFCTVNQQISWLVYVCFHWTWHSQVANFFQLWSSVSPHVSRFDRLSCGPQLWSSSVTCLHCSCPIGSPHVKQREECPTSGHLQWLELFQAYMSHPEVRSMCVLPVSMVDACRVMHFPLTVSGQ